MSASDAHASHLQTKHNQTSRNHDQTEHHLVPVLLLRPSLASSLPALALLLLPLSPPSLLSLAGQLTSRSRRHERTRRRGLGARTTWPAPHAMVCMLLERRAMCSKAVRHYLSLAFHCLFTAFPCLVTVSCHCLFTAFRCVTSKWGRRRQVAQTLSSY